jgi:hypothetical protein
MPRQHAASADTKSCGSKSIRGSAAQTVVGISTDALDTHESHPSSLLHKVKNQIVPSNTTASVPVELVIIVSLQLSDLGTFGSILFEECVHLPQQHGICTHVILY